MIVFTMIGVLLACVFFLWIAAIGAVQALFNNIGGTGSKFQTACGLFLFGAGCAGFFWMLKLSPFTLQVMP